jgi:hypothetical protein
MARKVCLAFSLDWYSSNGNMICRIMLLMGSSPSSWVIETSRDGEIVVGLSRSSAIANIFAPCRR